MTPQEKAGQLTQYFYMDFMRDQSGDGAPSQPEMVEAAMARSGVGSFPGATPWARGSSTTTGRDGHHPGRHQGPGG